MRDDVRAYNMVEHFGDPEATLVIDETGFVKKGEKSVGVARQYTGTAGKVENCQVGVFLASKTRPARAGLRGDRALYLAEEEMGFATKGELALRMLERAFDGGVRSSWVTGRRGGLRPER